MQAVYHTPPHPCEMKEEQEPKRDSWREAMSGKSAIHSTI